MNSAFATPQAPAGLPTPEQFDQVVMGFLRDNSSALPDGPIEHLRLSELQLGVSEAAGLLADIEFEMQEVTHRRVQLDSTELLQSNPTLREVIDFHYEALRTLLEKVQ